MSTFAVEVVRPKIRPHPNADALEVAEFEGYTTVVAKGHWPCDEEGRSTRLAAYVPPDSVIDTRRPEFEFLASRAGRDGSYRVKAIRLRGVPSFGLLVPAPPGAKEGDDVAGALGVTHYEPSLTSVSTATGKEQTFCRGGGVAPGPKDVAAPKYDLENFRRYHKLLRPGEPVLLSEKLDGCNARYVYADGEMHCGSRTEWKRPYPLLPTRESLRVRGCPEDRVEEVLAKLESQARRKSLWWQTLEDNPEIERFCRDRPRTVVYGEVFGNVNCIKYFADGHNEFRAFDLLLPDGSFVPALQALHAARNADLPWVPTLHGSFELKTTRVVPYDFNVVCEAAEGPTLVSGAKEGVIREGVVVVPVEERRDDHIGRIKLKAVSAAYLEKYR